MSNLIDDILRIEREWFMNVRTIFPSRCQEHPKVFELMRRSSYELWSEEALRKYLKHIKSAVSDGRNLMTERYARMDRMIPASNINPLIDKIVEIEASWAQEIFRKYPHIFRNDSLRGFKIYLRCELETYSDEVLELYYRDLERAKNEGRNLVQEKYLNLFKKLGYKSLEEVNDSAKEKSSFY
ncbi:MAG: DUF4125 family protein [Candidatus Lokiarchaeia archaeon]